MAITLTPEQEEQIREIAQNRGFASAEEYFNEFLAKSYETEMILFENRDEFSKMIDEGLEEAERGELLSAEEAKAEREAFKREYMASKRSAA
jgi:predicted transcriptional regulator